VVDKVESATHRGRECEEPGAAEFNNKTGILLRCQSKIAAQRLAILHSNKDVYIISETLNLL